MSETKNVHGGHRERVKQEFLSHGLDSFPDYRVLELLLFYAVPQGDTNPLAHSLMERFGSLASIMEAPVESLMEVPGVGRHTAALLKLIPQCAQRYLISRSSRKERFVSSEDFIELFQPYFFAERAEAVWLACLAPDGRLLSVRKMAGGGLSEVELTSRRAAEEALVHNAAAIVLAHNHPSGSPRPSQRDIESTRILKYDLAAVGVELYDHLVFADTEAVSMRASGLLAAD